MKRTIAVFALAALVGASLALVAAPFDLPTSQTVMRGNAARVQTLKAAVAAMDYFAAAEAFFDFAKASRQMAAMDPPKGSPEEWKKTWASFQDAALKGVGACGERDAAKLQKAMDEILAFMKSGHSTFRG